jgi:RNA polymerase sigma factor (sigma-70 family)
MTAADTHRAIDAVWRIESPRLIAGLARIVRDVGVAEELAQDALVKALEQWPVSGVPDNPGAWLMTAGKRRAIDHFRRGKRLERKHEQLGYELEARAALPDPVAALDDDIGDDLLRLMFTACHPVLPTEARIALTLRLVGGLTTGEIARAYLAPEPTIAQRIVRAKRTLAEARVPFEVPRGADRAARLSSVLEVLYLVFNEGYSASAGEDWMRPALVEDALRLGRVLAGLAPGEPEVHGLVALMEIQASRSAARLGPSGEPILLLDQNRARWDHLLIQRGLAALKRAEDLGGARGPYALQAAIADGGGDGLGAHCFALSGPGRGRPVAHRRAQPRRRGRHGLRAPGGARRGGRAGVRAAPFGLSPAAGGARRPAGEARALRRVPRRVRAGRRAHP